MIRDELIKQLDIAEQGLILHKKKCSTEMLGFHQLLEESFADLKKTFPKELLQEL